MELFDQLEGSWTGHQKLYLKPGELAGEGDTELEVNRMLGQLFVELDYTHQLDGTVYQGRYWLGFNPKSEQFSAVWIDEYHNGADIMDLQANLVEDILILDGGYHYGEDFWKWTIEIRTSQDTLSVQHFNQGPGVDRYLGVDLQYRRI